MLRTIVTLFSIMVLLSSVAAQAQDSANPAQASSIEALIKQLDAENFADRAKASEALQKLGKEAIGPLAEAATSKSAETATRALDILRKHFDSGDAATKPAAKDALEKLAAADKGASSRRAADILKPKPVPVPAQAEQRLTPAPGIRLAPRIAFGAVPRAAIEVRAAAVAGGATRVSMKTVDGVREIEVVEADRTIRITVDKDKGIRMKVTEKKDGKEVTKEYEAKDAEQLKKDHPEAHKYFERFGKADGGIRIEGIAVGPGGIAPIPVLPFPVLPAPAIRVVPDAAAARQVRELFAGIEKAQRQLEVVAEQLKSIDTADKADLEKAIKSLEEAKKELAELKDRAGK